MPLRQITFPVGVLACNCTILADEETATAIVIDPGAEVDRILSPVREHGWTIEAILVTHGHIDHIGGAAILKRETGAPVWMNPLDLPIYATLESQAHWIGVPVPESTPIDAELDARAHFLLGKTPLELLETPGHTQGSMSVYVPPEHKLFAGDTLFAGSIGRTDFPGGDYETILDTIRGSLLALPDETIVIPGHGPETTIGQERDTNPFLR